LSYCSKPPAPRRPSQQLGPVELISRTSDGQTILGSLLAAGRVTAAVAEHLAGEDHHVFVANDEVRKPPAFGYEHVGKLLGQLVGAVVLGPELDERLGRRHLRRLIRLVTPDDSGDYEAVDAQLGIDPDALR
jgi:hypothetical protein